MKTQGNLAFFIFGSSQVQSAAEGEPSELRVAKPESVSQKARW